MILQCEGNYAYCRLWDGECYGLESLLVRLCAVLYCTVLLYAGFVAGRSGVGASYCPVYGDVPSERFVVVCAADGVV